MKKIHVIVIQAFLVLSFFCAATGHAQPKAQFELLMREALSSAEGKDMTATRLEVEPGYKAQSHSHPGETFVYIVSGRILNQINDGEPTVYEAGDFFFEPANATHAQFVNEDTENSAVVIIVGIRPQGQN